jgi:hypothetical protein
MESSECLCGQGIERIRDKMGSATEAIAIVNLMKFFKAKAEF